MTWKKVHRKKQIQARYLSEYPCVIYYYVTPKLYHKATSPITLGAVLLPCQYAISVTFFCQSMHSVKRHLPVDEVQAYAHVTCASRTSVCPEITLYICISTSCVS